MTQLKYKQTISDGRDVWSYVIAVLPWQYGEEAVQLSVVSYDEEEASLQRVIDTLRYADGYNNGGVLDVDSIAVPE